MPRKDPLAHLSRHHQLTDALAREVRALGPAALPALRAMVTDPEVRGDRDTPARRAATNAAEILRGWPGPDASAILLEAFAVAPLGSQVLRRVAWALGRRGPDVVEALVAYRGTERDADALEALVDWGSRVDARDPRVTAWIAETIPVDPGRAAWHAAVWKDPSLVAPLEAAFDARFARDDIGEGASVLQALLEAAAECGSTDTGRLVRMIAHMQVEVREKEDEVARLRAAVRAVERVSRGR